MKFHPPRHPILVIGAGIAGLAAAYSLRELGVPYRLLERFPRAGGRLNSREGKGWVADHGAPYILRSDSTLQDLIRAAGMEPQLVTVQGGVHHLLADGTIRVPPGGGIDPDRQCIESGFAELFRRMGTQLGITPDVAVSAVRWDNDEKTFWWQKEGQVFWLEAEDGQPVRDPATHRILLGSGVILATTATAAHRICERSGSLRGVAGMLAGVSYVSTFTALFRVPRLRVPWYGLLGLEHPRLHFVSLEDRKAPERCAPDTSLLVVHCKPGWSSELIRDDPDAAMSAVYTELRGIVPELPEEPVSRTLKKWHVSRPSGAPLGLPLSAENPRGRWPVRPRHVPFALAGEYLLGKRAEDAARSGLLAAQSVLSQLPRRRRVLGLELPLEYPEP